MNKKSRNKLKAIPATSLRIYLIWLWAFFPQVKTNAQSANCTLQNINDSELRILTPADVMNKRIELIQAIWDSDHIPSRSDVIVSANIVSPLHPHSIVARIDKIEIPAQIPVKPGSKAVHNLAYLFVPVKRNGRLMIVHHGHACTFKDAQKSDKGYRMEAANHWFVDCGM